MKKATTEAARTTIHCWSCDGDIAISHENVDPSIERVCAGCGAMIDKEHYAQMAQRLLSESLFGFKDHFDFGRALLAGKLDIVALRANTEKTIGALESMIALSEPQKKRKARMAK